MIQLSNPLPVLLGIPLMAFFCWLLSRRVAILDDVSAAHAKTLSLDGLRGLLASAVFFHHAFISYRYFIYGTWDPPSSNFYDQLGQAPVTMFFFISGYLFWRKMLRDPASVSARRLLPNRARRILPAYFASTLLLFVIVAVSSRFQLREPAQDVAKQVISWLLSGLPFRGGPEINNLLTIPLTGGIFWTLQLEWLFYFVLPLMVWFRPIWMFLLTIPLSVAATFALANVHLTNPYLYGVINTLQWFAHMFWAGFAVGMLAAYGHRGERLDRILCSPWMTPAAVVLVALQLFFVPADYNYFEPFLLAPVFFMIVAGNSFLGILSSRPFRALGTVSYSLYVLHGELLHLLVSLLNHFRPIGAMAPLTYWGYILVIALIVTLCATLSYLFIEKPFFARRPA